MGDFFKQITRAFTPHAFKVEPEAIDPSATGGVNLTQNIIDALEGSNSAEAANPFATMNDLPVTTGPAIFTCISDGTTGLIVSYGSDMFERFGYNLPSTERTGAGTYKVNASSGETPFSQAFAIANPSAGIVGISVDCLPTSNDVIDIKFIESATGLPIDPPSFTVAIFMWA
jgi:hypothetical protein